MFTHLTVVSTINSEFASKVTFPLNSNSLLLRFVNVLVLCLTINLEREPAVETDVPWLVF